MPGMLHAVVVRSPHACARIGRLDTKRALAMPGVAVVLTATDVPRNTLWTDVPGQTTAVGPLAGAPARPSRGASSAPGGAGGLGGRRDLGTSASGRRGRGGRLRAGPGVFDPEDALAPGAPLVHEGTNLLAHWRITRGDVEAALARAATVVEGEYRTQFVDSSYLEPESGVAWLDTDGVITIRVSTQVIEHFRDVAEVLAVPQNRVRIIGTYLGGGFGGKEDVTVEVYLGLLVLRTGRPVKMVWSRQESLLARAKRHPYVMRYRTAAARHRRDSRPRHLPRVRRRGLCLPVGPGPALLHGDRGRTLSRPQRASGCTRGVHQQPAHERHARLRGDADGLRLRVADRSSRPRPSPRPG